MMSVGVFVIGVSCSGHKESRFLMGVYPVLSVLIVYGI